MYICRHSYKTNDKQTGKPQVTPVVTCQLPSKLLVNLLCMKAFLLEHCRNSFLATAGIIQQTDCLTPQIKLAAMIMTKTHGTYVTCYPSQGYAHIYMTLPGLPEFAYVLTSADLTVKIQFAAGGSCVEFFGMECLVRVLCMCHIQYVFPGETCLNHVHGPDADSATSATHLACAHHNVHVTLWLDSCISCSAPVAPTSHPCTGATAKITQHTETL